MTNERRNRILSGINLDTARILEVGPLAWPIVRKDEADVTYLDHIDTESLRRQYANDPAVPCDQIASIDATWDTLSGSFDYIIASHVVEHVPDLIGWLHNLSHYLAPNGEIRLVIPDKLFTFDQARDETRLADVLVAHALRAKVPQPQQVLSQFTQISPPIECTPKQAREWLQLAQETAGGTYCDVHCWVFTPRSWARLMIDLTACGLMPFCCSMWHDTVGNEFVVGMRHGSGEWARMALEARQSSIEDRLRAEIAALRQSTSWRLTAPLRWMAEKVRR